MEWSLGGLCRTIFIQIQLWPSQNKRLIIKIVKLALIHNVYIHNLKNILKHEPRKTLYWAEANSDIFKLLTYQYLYSVRLIICQCLNWYLHSFCWHFAPRSSSFTMISTSLTSENGSMTSLWPAEETTNFRYMITTAPQLILTTPYFTYNQFCCRKRLEPIMWETTAGMNYGVALPEIFAQLPSTKAAKDNQTEWITFLQSSVEKWQLFSPLPSLMVVYKYVQNCQKVIGFGLQFGWCPGSSSTEDGLLVAR